MKNCTWKYTAKGIVAVAMLFGVMGVTHAACWQVDGATVCDVWSECQTLGFTGSVPTMYIKDKPVCYSY